MFVEGFKEGLRYAGSVAERTVGFEAPRLIEQNLRNNNPPEILQRQRGVRTLLAATAWTYSLFLPATANVLSHPFDFKPQSSLENLGIFAKKIGPAILWDTGLMLADIVLLPHDPIEYFIAKRLAVNAITHLGMDYAGSNVNGTGKFRPTVTTLAV